MVVHISIVLTALVAIGLVCAAAAVWVAVFMPAPQRKGNGLAENVLWGKLFVAATYASISIVAFLAIGKLR